jgi:hypothetical protein
MDKDINNLNKQFFILREFGTNSEQEKVHGLERKFKESELKHDIK